MQGVEIDIAAIAAKFSIEKGLTANLVKSQPIKKLFVEVVNASKLDNGEKKVGNMLYSIATKLPVTLQRFRNELASLVGSGGISNATQLDYTIEYLKGQELKGGADIVQMHKACGVWVKMTVEQIAAVMEKQITTAHQKSKKVEYLCKVKEQIPFVEGKVLKQIFDKCWSQKGLPEVVVAQKGEKKQAEKVIQKAEEGQVFHIKDITELIGRQMVSSVNSKQNLKWRADTFGEGIILTRFPPEPNGYLHIGHCKAMRFNFMQAKVSNGHCYLRFDDTNPTKENIEFIENIKENIHFMGYEPWKITHASDCFEQLYHFAIKLIKQGDAFVCSETVQQMRKNRTQGIPSKDRNRSIAQNLRLFQQMRLGLHPEGAYSLRGKIDYKHSNTTMRDPVIYRIRYSWHPHVKDRWCIYPLYDYTHPICDSLEGISHSLCSLEFEIRRELYYWVLEKLNIYRPHVWEYSRLNITYTVLSKRKLHELVFGKMVSGWDDPRVLTINGMRRRGYPAQAINNFCDVIGVTRRGNENYINFGVLQNEVRKYLDVHAPRTMAVLEPVQLIIEDVQQHDIVVPWFSKNEEKGSRKIRLSRKIYVERSDIKLEDQKGFYGIAPNKVVGLKYAAPIFIKSVNVVDGIISSVVATLDGAKNKPNSFLNWISIEQSFPCEVRHYGLLFTAQRPGDLVNYLDYLNPKSMDVFANVQCHRDLLKGMTMTDRYQFERKGYYCLDKDSDIASGRIIWNQTVSLVDRNKK